MLSNSDILDTRFRSALERMAESGRLSAYTAPIDTDLAIAGTLKKHDGGPALMFTAVNGYDIPVIGNLLCCQPNCEAAFNLNFRGIRDAVGRALSAPIPPVVVAKGAAQENIQTEAIDIAATLPVLFHTAEDAGRFITAGVVIVRDPETGVYNASYHRLQLIGPNRTAIKLDYGRHLRLAFERAKRTGRPLPIAVCIGTDLALQYTAATMGSQMPENADELAAAGWILRPGARGRKGGHARPSHSRRYRDRARRSHLSRSNHRGGTVRRVRRLPVTGRRGANIRSDRPHLSRQAALSGDQRL
jgi:2,5-furandicarboxylate decarboxylase 1